MAKPKKVLVVDDDWSYSKAITVALKDAGFEVVAAEKAEEALAAAAKAIFAAAIIDVRLKSWPDLEKDEESQGVGIALVRRLRTRFPKIVVIGVSSEDKEEWFQSKPSMSFVRKPHRIDAIVQELKRLLYGEKHLPQIFIVHGRDLAAALELKNFIQNSLQLGVPVILSEQPSKGKTVIEKFEEYASTINRAFVLLTPDDVGKSRDENILLSRARQNVLFEVGYFVAALGRTQGRVILLQKGKVEIPSDLHGVVYIDISNGIMAAGEEIRREIQEFLEM